MSGKVTFVLGIHNHQPVGNFDHVIEDAYEKAYRPFLEVMADYPDIPFALHNSGILWDWFGSKHPEYVDMLSKMVSSGQVELMSAGYYEPILTVIPGRDRLGQLSMMKEHIVKKFGALPRGCWLTERIWDPNIPGILEEAGLEYVVVDDSHFKSTGFKSEDMRGYFLSEDDGSYIKVFPIDKRLRYLIPFHPPGEVLEYLRSVAGESGSGRIAVLADDGEKFGLWTGTHALCYRENWLRCFCESLRANMDWIEMSNFSNVIDTFAPLGIVYLPTASYSEMMEWALPLRAQKSYKEAKDILDRSGRFPDSSEAVRGGFWRNFMVKYEESNWMHKRMLGVSEDVESYAAGSGDGRAASEARRHLYKAQCNCAYWHGLFGGLYLPHLRSAVFSHLAAAEALVEGDSGESAWIRHSLRDLDGDGVQELIASTPVLKAFFKMKGAVLRELDFRKPSFNLTDTLTRREEIYHSDLVKLASKGAAGATGGAVSIHDLSAAKEDHLERFLVYDREPRASLVDRFLDAKTTFSDYKRGAWSDQGDFAGGLFSLKASLSKTAGRFEFSRSGFVIQEGRRTAVRMVKAITIAAERPVLEIEYSIIPRSESLKGLFAVESVFSFLAGDAPDRYFIFRCGGKSRLGSAGEEPGVGAFSMVDEWMDLGIAFEFDPVALLWRYPVETVSNSDSGFERVYQGSSICPVWPVDSAEGQEKRLTIRITIGCAAEVQEISLR